MPILSQGSQPLYQQLADELRQPILDGELQVGAALPSEPQLASRYGVSRATAREAIQVLVQAGLVNRRRGRGTFVTRPKLLIGNVLLGFSDEMRILGHRPGARTLRQVIEPASEDVATALEIAAGTPVVVIRRLRLVDGQPVALSDVHLPASRCAGLANDDLESNSLYHLLEGKYNVRLMTAEKEIEATAAPPEVAQTLGIATGSPVLYSRKRTFDDQGVPVEDQIAYWRGDRYKFRVTERQQAMERR